jgi:threonylcarbamoyladenosine tRNA methylthiotransferase MtaB
VALQSGDENVLKRMRRRYKPGEFLSRTNLIREMIPDAAIGTDVMVGFPGETDREFENTRGLLLESPLTYYHVFPYSKRKYTRAANMEGQIPKAISKSRGNILRDQGFKKKQEFYKRFIGKKVPVIIETGSKGTSRNYMAVRVLDGNLKVGDEAVVEIQGVQGEAALGIANFH